MVSGQEESKISTAGPPIVHAVEEQMRAIEDYLGVQLPRQVQPLKAKDSRGHPDVPPEMKSASRQEEKLLSNEVETPKNRLFAVMPNLDRLLNHFE